MMNHYRSTRKAYDRQRKSDDISGQCPFCDLGDREIVSQSEHCVVVYNLTKYDLWELHKVEEHLMILPKRHVEALDELNDEEMLSMMKTIAEYERLGYSAYARGVGFVRRSVKHQHTHLIKVSNVEPKLAIYSERPYWLFKI